MYEAGNIIYFNPFYFNTGTSKSKYFLVLKNMGNTTIIASLPSSIAHLPIAYAGRYGCINEPLSGISCYILQQGKVVTENGFSFPKETYLHGHWLSEHDLVTLSEAYQVEGVDYEIIGKLVDAEFNAIIACFKSSKVVKNKFRRVL